MSVICKKSPTAQGSMEASCGDQRIPWREVLPCTPVSSVVKVSAVSTTKYIAPWMTHHKGRSAPLRSSRNPEVSRTPRFSIASPCGFCRNAASYNKKGSCGRCEGRIVGRLNSSNAHEQSTSTSSREDPRATYRHHRWGDGHDDPNVRHERGRHPRGAFQRCDEEPSQQR